MPAKPLIPISPFSMEPKAEEFQAILSWPFPDHPFYKTQIKRLLQNDIPQRVAFNNCQVWAYRTQREEQLVSVLWTYAMNTNDSRMTSLTATYSKDADTGAASFNI